ncbi:MAG: hypothetical protein Q8Q62_19600 [Mesorhizobium sp.]|nr:hypothetical protein [Mesorhizobium sp.]
MHAAQDDMPDRSRLRHIVVMLLSMALLCERAAAFSHPVRCLVFRLLSHAEIAALSLFEVPADGIDASPDEPVHVEPEELIALAARLRVIAILLARAFLSGDETCTAKGAVQRPIGRAPSGPARDHPSAPYHDTS